MFAMEIAAQLDCSYQLVGKRGRTLAERDLVSRGENEKGRRVFEITTIAQKFYFDVGPEDRMDFGEQDLEPALSLVHESRNGNEKVSGSTK